VSVSRLDVVVHELRSPVAALAAIAEAYPTADDATRRRLVELARAAAASIDRLLADGATTSLDPVGLDAGALVRDAVETAAVGGASVVAETQLGLTVAGDADRLRQALDNLIENALGHSPAGGTVIVRAGRVGASVAITVTDEGDGLEPDDLERIFDPGVRRTSARPGSGLGLAIVREIAQAHGGDVEVESSPGQGATFRLVLPGASGVG